MAPSARTRTEWCGVGRTRLVALFTAVSLMFAGAACSADETAELPTGVYVGFNQGQRLLRFEQELGAPVELVVTMADSRSPEAMSSSVYGQFAASDAYLPDLSDRLDVVVSVPLAFGPGGLARTAGGREVIGRNLRATADGRHDDDFRLVADYLVNAGFEDAIIRLGHEFDSDWAPYSARDNSDAYIAAFRHVHDVLTAESPAFLFDWTSMVPYFVEHGPAAYPGDDVVDVIGIDAYWRAPSPSRTRNGTACSSQLSKPILILPEIAGSPCHIPNGGARSPTIHGSST